MRENSQIINKNNPLLTIAIPTFNRPKFLKEALNSAVNQSTKEYYEIIVIDNSFDKEIIKKVDKLVNTFSHLKNIRFYRNENNIGMFGNWNECLKKANGKYITLLNDDDLLDFHFVENVIKDLNGEIMLIYDYEVFHDQIQRKIIGGKLRNILNKLDLRRKQKIKLSDILFRNPSNGSLGVVVKKDNAISIGGYNHLNYPSSDYFFNLKYIKKFGGYKIRKKLCRYRFSVNESQNIRCLYGFINQDFLLREQILNQTLNKGILILISKKLNSLQAISQSNRYLYINNLRKLDFNNLEIGVSKKMFDKGISLLKISPIICILCELLILLSWKIILKLQKVS